MPAKTVHTTERIQPGDCYWQTILRVARVISRKGGYSGKAGI